MDSLEVAWALVGDPRPAVRLRGVEVATGASGGEVEALLVRAMADESEQVASAAREALLFRQPWLRLHPFQTRPLPRSARDTPWARAWTSLAVGLGRWLDACPSAPSIDLLLRWAYLPGAIPDLIEALESHRLHEPAARLAERVNLWGSSKPGTRQVLFCPTYACNLDCPYCYARGWHRLFEREMARPELDLFFRWCEENEIGSVVLGGGEPTLFGHLEEFLTRARDLNLRVSLTSNTLFGDSVRELLASSKSLEFIAHYDQALLGRPCLNDVFEANLRAVRDHGIRSFVRYTLTEASDAAEWDRVIDLALRFEVPAINYAFAFGNVLGNNAFVRHREEESAERFEQQFRTFFDACQQAGLGLHLCKPIPLCLVSEDLLRRLLSRGAVRAACGAYLDGFGRNLTVNPDLSTFPCSAVGVPGPTILELPRLEALRNHHAPLLERLLFRPFFQKCTDCMFSYRGFCQGVCLAQKQGMCHPPPAGAAATRPMTGPRGPTGRTGG